MIYITVFWMFLIPSILESIPSFTTIYQFFNYSFFIFNLLIFICVIGLVFNHYIRLDKEKYMNKLPKWFLVVIGIFYQPMESEDYENIKVILTFNVISMIVNVIVYFLTSYFF